VTRRRYRLIRLRSLLFDKVLLILWGSYYVFEFGSIHELIAYTVAESPAARNTYGYDVALGNMPLLRYVYLSIPLCVSLGCSADRVSPPWEAAIRNRWLVLYATLANFYSTSTLLLFYTSKLGYKETLYDHLNDIDLMTSARAEWGDAYGMPSVMFLTCMNIYIWGDTCTERFGGAHVNEAWLTWSGRACIWG